MLLLQRTQAIIAVELTGQASLTLPVSLTVIVAYFTANRIAPSVYKMMLLVHEIPHMGDMSKKLKYVPIGRVIGALTWSSCVYDGFTVGNIIELLRRNPTMDWFPVVDVLDRDYIMPSDSSASRARSPSG